MASEFMDRVVSAVQSNPGTAVLATNAATIGVLGLWYAKV